MLIVGISPPREFFINYTPNFQRKNRGLSPIVPVVCPLLFQDSGSEGGIVPLSAPRSLRALRAVQTPDGRGLALGACLGMKNIGKPCAGEPHARFDEGGQAKACSLLYPIIAAQQLGRTRSGGICQMEMHLDIIKRDKYRIFSCALD